MRSTCVENALQINLFYAKQSQFPKGQNEHKYRYNKILQKHTTLPEQAKQTQTKPISKLSKTRTCAFGGKMGKIGRAGAIMKIAETRVILRNSPIRNKKFCTIDR